jgi:AraC-like DNA-binding protein
MIKEYENQYTFRAQLLKTYFRIFLILLSRQLEGNLETVTQTREAELVKCFMGMLDKYFREKRLVSNYSSQMSVTANYLNRIVKKNTGYSARHHIRQRVVLEAKRMGRYSESCMKEIAYELGFLDLAHFSRFFKSVAGTNFSDFKKQALNLSATTSFNRA